jgi:hypothetical protein
MTKLKPQENVKQGYTVSCTKLHEHPLTYYENTQSVQNSINKNYNQHINIITACQICNEQHNDAPLWCCLQSHGQQKIIVYCNTCFETNKCHLVKPKEVKTTASSFRRKKSNHKSTNRSTSTKRSSKTNRSTRKSITKNRRSKNRRSKNRR